MAAMHAGKTTAQGWKKIEVFSFLVKRLKITTPKKDPFFYDHGMTYLAMPVFFIPHTPVSVIIVPINVVQVKLTPELGFCH